MWLRDEVCVTIFVKNVIYVGLNIGFAYLCQLIVAFLDISMEKHCHFIYLVLTLLVLSCSAASLSAQEEVDSLSGGAKYVHRLGFDFRGAYVASSAHLDNYGFAHGESTVIHSAVSAYLKYSFSYTSATRLGRLYPGAYQGIGVGATSFFDNWRVGTPVNVYVFQGAPVKRLSRKLSIDYEWNFGASFGWEKYHTGMDPVNIVVGSDVNAYINLGFMLNYRFTKNWSLTAGLDMTHYSNGNTSWPNPGVNTIGGRVGMVYRFGGSGEPAAGAMPHEEFRPHMSYDLMAYCAARKRMLFVGQEGYDSYPELLPGRFGILGLNFAPMYNFNRYFRAGVSADFQYDESSGLPKYWIEGTTGEDIKFYRPPYWKQISGGLSVRGELVMPIFSINAGIGYNFFGSADSRNCYQVLALKVHVARSLFLNVGYQLNSFHNPNNLMLGIGYTFHNLR